MIPTATKQKILELFNNDHSRRLSIKDIEKHIGWKWNSKERRVKVRGVLNVLVIDETLSEPIKDQFTLFKQSPKKQELNQSSLF